VQGSVTGPLLLVLFRNDIANLFNGGIVYADDLKLYSSDSFHAYIHDILHININFNFYIFVYSILKTDVNISHDKLT